MAIKLSSLTKRILILLALAIATTNCTTTGGTIAADKSTTKPEKKARTTRENKDTRKAKRKYHRPVQDETAFANNDYSLYRKKDIDYDILNLGRFNRGR